MQLINGLLFVETTELREFGISYPSIQVGASRFRTGAAGSSKSWISVKHPEHSNRLLILYSSVPAKYRAKYNLPTEAEMLARLERESARNEAIAKILAEYGR